MHAPSLFNFVGEETSSEEGGREQGEKEKKEKNSACEDYPEEESSRSCASVWVRCSTRTQLNSASPCRSFYARPVCTVYTIADKHKQETCDDSSQS